MPYYEYQESQMWTSNSRSAHDHRHNNSPMPRDARVRYQCNPGLEERCNANIMSLHLSAEEQLAESEGFKGVDWLKEEAPWPPAAQRRVHRYMHHHDLYQVRNVNDPVFVDLVNLVKSEAGVPNTRNWEHKVPSKCISLIDMSTRAWKRDGILVTRNNVITKSRLFQYLWNSAVQAALLNNSASLPAGQNLPLSSLENDSNSIECDSVNGAAGPSGDSYARKRNAESAPLSLAADSAKRARTVQFDGNDGDSIIVDVHSVRASDHATQLDDGSEMHPTEVSNAGSSVGIPHKDQSTTSPTFDERLQRQFEPIVQAARDALCTLDPTENTFARGRITQREGTGLEQNDTSADSTVDSNPISASTFSGQDNQNLSYNHVTTSPGSSGRSSSDLTHENHSQPSFPIPTPVSTPRVSQCDTSASVVSPRLQRLRSPGPSGRSLETEQGVKISLPGMRTLGLFADNPDQAFQVGSRCYLSNIKETMEGAQGVGLPDNHSTSAGKVHSNLEDQRMGRKSSGSDSGASFERDSASTSSEDSEFSEQLEGMEKFSLDFDNSVAHTSVTIDSSVSRDTSRRVSTNSVPFSGVLHQGEISNGIHRDASTNGAAMEVQRQGTGINRSINDIEDSTGRGNGPSHVREPKQPSLDARTYDLSSVQEMGAAGLAPSSHAGLPVMHLSPPQPPSSCNPKSQNPFPECSRGRHIPGCPHPPPSMVLRQTPSPTMDPKPQYRSPPQTSPQYPRPPLNSGQPPPPPSSTQYQPLHPHPPIISSQPPPPSPLNQYQPSPPPPPPSARYQPPPPPIPQNQNNLPHPPPSTRYQPPPPLPQSQNNPPPPPPSTRYQPPPPLLTHPPTSQPQNQAHPPPSTQYQPPPPQLHNEIHPYPPLQQQPPPHAPDQNSSLYPIHPPQPPPSQPQNEVHPPTPLQFQPLQPCPQYQHCSPDLSQPQSQPLVFECCFPSTKTLSETPLTVASSHQFISPNPIVPEPKSSPSDQPHLENDSLWRRFLETIAIIVPFLNVRPITNSFNAPPAYHKEPISIMDRSVVDFFQWFSSIVRVDNVSILRFDFVDASHQLRRSFWVTQRDPLTFASVRTEAWNLFQRRDLDPGLANFQVVITISLTIPEGVNTNIPMQPHHSDFIKTTSDTQHDYALAMPPQNRDNDRTASDVTGRTAKPQPRSAPSKPRGGLFKAKPRTKLCNPASDTTNGETSHTNILKDDKDSLSASALLSQEAQLLSQQPSRPQNPSSEQIASTTTTTTEIVIRLQVDDRGGFSHSYGKSVLSSKISNGRFFDWFARETRRKDPKQLKFYFKDALPEAKCSVIERGHDDHFELMVNDIKRKFDHARKCTPDMKEFTILVTDPTWHYESGDEDEDV